MPSYIPSRRALRALQEITEYRRDVAGDGAGLRLEARLLDAYEVLGEQQGLGSRRSYLTTHPTYRFWPVENYWVVYRPRRRAPPVIVTFVDGRRDVRRLLG